MKRTDFLINDVRSVSKNEANTDGTLSIPDEEVLRYLNDAQDRAQGIISNNNPANHPFTVSREIAVTANLDGYDIGDRIFYNKEFAQVEFSASGAITDYTTLEKVAIFNRDTNTNNYPTAYYISFGKLYLVPVLSTSTGKLRIMYERTLDDLDKRRGTVSVVTGLTSTSFTSITIGSDADETSTPNLSTIDYICINDKFGAVKAYNIPVLSYNTGTQILIPDTSFVFQTGETITAGDFVTFGKYTTTHSKLIDGLERYLIHYGVEAMLHKDSSDDVVMQSNILQAMEKDMKDSFSSQSHELQGIPQYDYTEWW